MPQYTEWMVVVGVWVSALVLSLLLFERVETDISTILVIATAITTGVNVAYAAIDLHYGEG